MAIRDHPVAGNDPPRSITHLPRTAFAAKLARGFHHAEEPRATAGLAARELAAARIEREAAVVREPVLVEKAPDRAFLTEAEVLDLHRRHDREIVVALHELHV